MHYVHLIAVEADNEADAVAEAEAQLAQYGNGDVYDWYEVGGRWEGYLNGKNALRYSDNPTLFGEALESCKRARNREMKDILDKLSGRFITPEDVDDTIMGLPIPDKGYTAQRINEQNSQEHALFQELLASDDPVQWSEGHRGLLGHYLYKLGKLIAGYYSTDSYFYDATAMDPSFDYVLARCKVDPTTQWLVTVDLHN